MEKKFLTEPGRYPSHHRMAPVGVSCWGCTPTPTPQEGGNAQRAQVPGPPRLGSCMARRHEVRLSVLKHTECHHSTSLHLTPDAVHSSTRPPGFLRATNRGRPTSQAPFRIQGFSALNQIGVIGGWSATSSRPNALPVRRKVGEGGLRRGLWKVLGHKEALAKQSC